MLNCPNCNTVCIKGANYCHMCGIYLVIDSNADNSQSKSDTKIDSEFNSALRRLMPTPYIDKLISAKGKIEGERRVVTILFSDVKGSTSMAEKLDPEEVLEIMNGAFEILIAPITKYEGTLARLMGDAILAFFGAPIAHEDDPDRACRAALDILNGAKDYSLRLAKEKGIEGFNVRVGINTGLVVVAEVGADFRVEYTAMGDAVNIAARMESAAEPGTIMITEDTRKLLTDNFITKSLGSITVKGKSDPINVYNLVGYDKIESINSLVDKPYVGRENERNNLSSWLNEVINGNGSIISIIGEHGIGKSRIVEKIREDYSKDIRWIICKSLAYMSKDSYWLAREMFKKVLSLNTNSNVNDLKERLFEFKEFEPSININDFVHPFSQLLNIKVIEEKSLSETEELKRRIHFTSREIVRLEALKQPLVVVLDDLHWSDITTLEMICDMLDLTKLVPLSFVFIFRPNEGKVWKQHQKQFPTLGDSYKAIYLKELELNESKKLLEILSDNYLIPNEIKNKIIDKTGGNPFFIGEVVKSLIDRQLVSKDLNIGISDKLSREIDTPNLLHNVIMSRIDILSNDEKLILQLTSVIGKVFKVELLKYILTSYPLTETVENLLNELVRKEFIEIRNGQIATEVDINGLEYKFKHSILQEVLYESLLKSQKKKNHKLIGQCIEKLYLGNILEHFGILATHFEKCEEFLKAVKYHIKAGDKSKNIFANEEAIYHYTYALILSDKTEVVNNDLIHLHESLGDIYFLKSEYPESLKSYNRILEFDLNNEKKSDIYRKCGKACERWGKYDDALEYYNKGDNCLGKDSENIIAVRIYSGIGMVFYRKGDLARAKENLLKSLSICKSSVYKADIAQIYNNLGIIYGKLDEYDLSMKYHKQCLEIRKEINHSSGLAASYNNIGYLFQTQLEYDKAIEHYELSIKYCKKTGNLHGLASAYDNLSQVYSMQDNDEIAQEYNLKAITLIGKIASTHSEVEHDIWLQSGVW